MSEIPLQISRNWTLRTPEVYRYLPRQDVDQFFEKGELQLGSFKHFQENQHPESGDASEGKGILVSVNKDAPQTVYAALQANPSAYVLSTSLSLSRKLADAFECDACFRINDTVSFAEAIASFLPGFNGGMEGPCDYAGQRIVRETLSKIDLSPGKMPSISELNAMFNNACGNSLLFAKARNQSGQAEYRFLWTVSAPLKDTYLVPCPEAVKFCERVEIPKE